MSIQNASERVRFYKESRCPPRNQERVSSRAKGSRRIRAFKYPPGRHDAGNRSSSESARKDEVKKKFLRGAQRYSILRRTKLLYEYTPIQDNQIRLLYLHPATSYESDIYVSLRTHMDDEVGPEQPQQAYDALSYHWGSGPANAPIYLADKTMTNKLAHDDTLALAKHVHDKNHAGVRLYVRSNLDKALRYLRDKSDTMVLWIDALCINQYDESTEKVAQISKMHHIYRKASNVCIWLGDGMEEKGRDRRDDFYAAMDFVQRLVISLENLDFFFSPEFAKYWSNLWDLMRSCWFSRRWVIQELALAREATVHCGTRFVPWSDFADAIGLFYYNSDRVRALFERSKDFRIQQNYDAFNEQEPLGAKVLVDAITNNVRKSLSGNTFEPIFSLETLVCSLTSFKAADPRDSVFALLNIAREATMPNDANTVRPPRPNYSLNLLEVYTDFLEWVVFSTRSLDILCRKWAAPEKKRREPRKHAPALVTLPSWIQTIGESPWKFHGQGTQGHPDEDSLVGRPGRARYNASRGQSPGVRFGMRWRCHTEPLRSRMGSAPPDVSTDSRISLTPFRDPFPAGRSTAAHRLHARGIVIATLNWVSGRETMGTIHKEYLVKGGWVVDGGPPKKVPDKLWRTLVADRDEDGNNTPPWYHMAALHCMALADSNGHLVISELLEQEIQYRQRLPQLSIEYLKRVQAVTWNRKFIQGAPSDPGCDYREPVFGLGPPPTQAGDRVCIIFGCSVPCILRPRIGYHEFIGEAYVYGSMDGEAINMLGSAELQEKTEEFLIV
ncbi:hypothetical protein PG984_012418 [Apiospora sp. TS-2023a]